MDPTRLFLLGFLVVLAGLYGLHGHALATIARKTGQGALMEVLAWLPGLQLIPTLRIAGVNMRRVLLHMAGLGPSAGALFAVSALLEGGRRTFLSVTALGLRVGIWTRFHASGAVRAQAELRGGLQHGWLVSFDERGERQQAVRFQQGMALR